MSRIAIPYYKGVMDHSCITCIKCCTGITENKAEFSQNDDIELVAMADCGDCPGFVVPRIKLLCEVTKGFKRSIETLHLVTCIKIALDTTACPIDFIEPKLVLESRFGINVVLSTHSY